MEDQGQELGQDTPGGFERVSIKDYGSIPHEEARAMTIPEHVEYLIIGAGVHGLSTAYHLALELRARGKGSGADVLIVDKAGVAAGASGIACGVVRNNYFQPAMRQLM